MSEPVPLELSLCDKIHVQDDMEPTGTGEVCKEHVSHPGSLRASTENKGGCVAPKASCLTETHSHCYNIATCAATDAPQGVKLAALPGYRSHSDASAAPQAPDSKACGRARPVVDRRPPEAEGHSMLACKQPMQLQQCNMVTTVCRGASGGELGAQQPQSKCMCCLFPRAVDDKCYGSLMHHANFEDTFAAYCHPQPIPAPSQLLPRLTGIEPSGDVPPLAAAHLTPPRLISSVSETGLDAKRLLQCCNLRCSLLSSLPPGPAKPSQKHYIEEECCSCATAQARTVTRDVGTMTVQERRDVGVQTGERDSATPHVFPHICLATGRSETSSTQTPNADSDAGEKPGGAPKTPVKEVKWDAEGMTWEVYGASVDPEELGLAIQRHLELQIKETASRAAKLSRQNTSTSRQSGNTGCQKKRSRRMSYVRAPACCTSTTTAVD